LKFNLHFGATKKDEAYVCVYSFLPLSNSIPNDLNDHLDCSCKKLECDQEGSNRLQSPCSRLLVLCLSCSISLSEITHSEMAHLLPPRYQVTWHTDWAPRQWDSFEEHTTEQPKLPGPKYRPQIHYAAGSTRLANEELKRYLKMRFLEDGWAWRAGAEHGTDIGQQKPSRTDLCKTRPATKTQRRSAVSGTEQLIVPGLCAETTSTWSPLLTWRCSTIAAALMEANFGGRARNLHLSRLLRRTMCKLFHDLYGTENLAEDPGAQLVLNRDHLGPIKF
jgi:hypothetical protein